MLRVLLDTNILLDVALKREPWYDASKRLIEAGQDGSRMRAGVASLSLKDAYFVITKRASEAEARQYLHFIAQSCEILSVDAKTCAMALSSTEPDFEDGLIAAAAIQAGVDIIISRDETAFNNLPIPKIDPIIFADFFLRESPYPNQTDEFWAATTVPTIAAGNAEPLA